MSKELDPLAAEAALIRRAQSGDQVAVDAVCESVRPVVIAIARKVADENLDHDNPRAEDAWEHDDAIQEAWLLTLSALHSFEPKARFGNYLRTLLAKELRKSRSRDRLMPVPSQGRETNEPPCVVGDDATDFITCLFRGSDGAAVVIEKEETCLAEQQTLYVGVAIRELPEKHRVAVEGVLAGETHKQIAKRVGCSRQRVGQLVEEAATEIRAALEVKSC